MTDNHYKNRKLAELYDLDSPWSEDREFYLSLAGDAPQSILDLGCGTGLICDAYAAKGHDVTGADPSAAMLEVARRKPHGDKIEWVEAYSQNFKSEKRFDLVIMTGHAFQVLLDDADILSTFATMRQHLKPEGKIVFESRNPAIDWAAQWDYDMTLDGNIHEARRFREMKNGRMTFELRYKFPDEELVSDSELRFTSRAGIETLLKSSGLYAEKVLGDWDGKPFDERTSKEMIFVIRAAT